MVIPHTTPAAIPDVIFTEQILFVDIPFGAIGGRAFSGAPPFDQFKAIIAIDYADDGIEELLFGDGVVIDICAVARMGSVTHVSSFWTTGWGSGEIPTWLQYTGASWAYSSQVTNWSR